MNNLVMHVRDNEQDSTEVEEPIGDDVEVQKTKIMYTFQQQQKKWIVANAKKHSIVDTHGFFSMPRTSSTDGWKTVISSETRQSEAARGEPACRQKL